MRRPGAGRGPGAWIPAFEGTEGGRDEGCGDGLDGLTDALDVTTVLESGAFTNATGFKLEGTDTAVVDKEAGENAVKTSGRIELSLTWTAR